MKARTLSKQVSIQDFVSELRKFPESAFGRADQIAKFLASMLVAPGHLGSLPDLGSASTTHATSSTKPRFTN